MAVRQFKVEKEPGTPGFVDEFNGVVGEISALASKIVRIDFKSITVGTLADREDFSLPHNLGVTPDFVWPIVLDGSSGADMPIHVSEAQKRIWDERLIRLWIGPTGPKTILLLIFALG